MSAILKVTYQALLLQNGILLDHHVIEHDSVLDEENADGDKRQNDGLEEEDPFASGRDRIETAKSIGDRVGLASHPSKLGAGIGT